jgi:hypothetical protein
MMIGYRGSQVVGAVEFLILFLFLVGPATVSAHAQTGPRPGVSMDAWRSRLTERLDKDLLQLEAAAQSEPPTSEAVRSNLSEAASRFSPAAASQRESWLPTVESILRERGLPAALLGVAAVESGFNPQALSPKGALGLWQLMPATARRYGLVVDAGRDERLDPVKSTYAATRYLKDLYAQFGDWPLALAAYNAGEDRVQRALERSGARDFWSLSRRSALPDETRRYVPAVLAEANGSLDSSGLAFSAAPDSANPSKALFMPRRLPSASMQVVYAMASSSSEDSASIN